MENRPGLQAMLAAAADGAFERVLVEDTDRLARDREHDAHIFKRLTYHGVVISTLTSDEVTAIESTFKGLMNEQYLVGLRQKTKRGMHANAEQGKATGSRLYGYSTAPGGETTIVEAQAAVIRRIMADFVAGDTPRQIAAALNAERIPGPRGNRWNASSINGNRQRGNGILRTDQYDGVKVWNRMDVRRDPVSGKRLPKMRPQTEWKRTDVPHLRIVDKDVVAAVRARQASEERRRPETLRRRPGPFSGLLKCGVCGGSYTVYTTGKLICATHREQGDAACTNRRTPNRADIEARAIAGIRDRLLSPDAVAGYVRAHHAAAAARRADLTARRQPLEHRLGELRRSIERVVDRICDGTAAQALEQRLMEMEAERVQIEAELSEANRDEPPVQLHPRAGAQYAVVVGELHKWLHLASTGETRAQRELTDALRTLIEKVEIIPRTQDRGGPIDIVLHGRLAAFLDGGLEPTANFGLGALVAGGGIEPPTCGL